MTPEPYPDVAGRWTGRWWFAADAPGLAGHVPMEGHVTVAAQSGGDLRGEAYASVAGVRVRFRISGTVEPDGATVLAFNEELENDLEVAEDGIRTEAAEAAEGSFADGRLELSLEVYLVPTGPDAGEEGSVLLRFAGRRDGDGIPERAALAASGKGHSRKRNQGATVPVSTE